MIKVWTEGLGNTSKHIHPSDEYHAFWVKVTSELRRDSSACVLESIIINANKHTCDPLARTIMELLK